MMERNFSVDNRVMDSPGDFTDRNIRRIDPKRYWSVAGSEEYKKKEPSDYSFDGHGHGHKDFVRKEKGKDAVVVIDKSGGIENNIEKYLPLKKIKLLKIWCSRKQIILSDSIDDDSKHWNIQKDTITKIRTLLNICQCLEIYGVVFKESLLHKFFKECKKVIEVKMDGVNIIRDKDLSHKPFDAELNIQKMVFKKMDGKEFKSFKPILKMLSTNSTMRIELESCENIRSRTPPKLFSGMKVNYIRR